jgi:hypothetical protein
MVPYSVTDVKPSRDVWISITTAQAWLLSWVSDILISIAVLNLAIEYSNRIIIDSFTVSILTAALMKALLVIILRLESGVSGYFESRGGAAWKSLHLLSTFALLFLSKFVILEAVNFVFGDHVEITGYITIVLLVIAMMGASFLMRLVYATLGPVAARKTSATA